MHMRTGIFGTIHSKYERKGQKAVDFLVRKKEGEVPNAIYHSEIGWIDLVWGIPGTQKGDGYGLSKIVKYHKSVLPKLAVTIQELRIISNTVNRIKLENDQYTAVVSKVFFENQKTWLLTFFEKRKK